jgi:hypothetical protein
MAAILEIDDILALGLFIYSDDDEDDWEMSDDTACGNGDVVEISDSGDDRGLMDSVLESVFDGVFCMLMTCLLLLHV